MDEAITQMELAAHPSINRGCAAASGVWERVHQKMVFAQCTGKTHFSSACQMCLRSYYSFITEQDKTKHHGCDISMQNWILFHSLLLNLGRPINKGYDGDVNWVGVCPELSRGGENVISICLGWEIVGRPGFHFWLLRNRLCHWQKP